MRVLQVCLTYVALFAAAATLSVSCIEVSYDVVSYRCDPKQKQPCPLDDDAQWVCCSDDPASAPGRLPRYDDKDPEGKWGVPLFSGDLNNLSRSGMCVNVSLISGGLPEGPAQGCLTPCNPTWSKDDIESVCGDGYLCCQTAEITEKDCVFDPRLGDEGCWVPADGKYIGDSNEEFNESNDGFQGNGDPWASATHDTHQDPGGAGCKQLADSSDDFDAGDCYEVLSVANQRGFCAQDSFSMCNSLQSDYQDACDRLNDSGSLSGCGGDDDDDDDDDDDTGTGG